MLLALYFYNPIDNSDNMSKEPKPVSVLRGKRELMRLNDHDVVVIVPDKRIPFEEGREKIRKLLKEFE